jgi:hypothetical protein
MSHGRVDVRALALEEIIEDEDEKRGGSVQSDDAETGNSGECYWPLHPVAAGLHQARQS